ncbi:hypothetical protein QUC26_17580 [Pseudomonas asiatica]|uniref:hypothetical protein n=1 Tax=Pseudomonas asiatica TaxID=2219225 RepID=UPI0025A231A1|nr:hypothetical protein [Pseudomonas asiatica]MDM9589566.1 hypothetical protein [Pseudomonas asiatica]WJM51677.1 hypothetical protein QUC26_17580 [Pseudomonas asiatica]
MPNRYSPEELLLADRVLSRVEAMSDPSKERARLRLRPDETCDELLRWELDNSHQKCLERVMEQLRSVAQDVREKSTT